MDHNKLWKILKEMGMTDLLYLPPEKLKKQLLELAMEQ